MWWLSVFERCFLTVGGSTMRQSGGRRMYCGVQHSRITGVAALKRAATPAAPTFPAGRTTCRSYCSLGNNLDLIPARRGSQPCTSVGLLFRGSCAHLRAESSAKRGGSSWRARSHVFPMLV